MTAAATAGQQLRSMLCSGSSTALQGLRESGGRVPQAKPFRLAFLQQHAPFQQRHIHQPSFCWQPWSAARSQRHLCSAAAGGGGGDGEGSSSEPIMDGIGSSSSNGSGGGGVLTSVDGDIIPDSWEDVTDAGRIVPYELHREASESYLAYAMSVIVGRALPDVRDGLKPVHRRILFAMHELGLASNKPFRKCARVVGEVLGKYHPHGDTAVYDALVRLAQDFSMRAPLVNGHGNFGSLDNDPPAAMRYTECRLQQLSSAALLMDLDSDTVDMVPNFDGSQMEPSVLPARLPNLLVNGSSGIAVGIATKIPPHNMGEVVAALKALISDPSISTERLMSHVPAPDFPTGGVLLKGSGIREAYGEGRGGFTLRGKVVIQEEQVPSASKRRRGGGRNLIVVTEIPYQTNKADLVTKISQLVNDRVIEGIADVRDESDREGMRVVVEVKNGTQPELILNQLYHHTRLQVRFSCNMVALVDGRPVMLGLKQFLSEFLEWRCTVIQRRSQYEATKARTRLHLVEGFVAVLSDVDRAVKLIRAAPDTAAAGAELADAFGLSKEQTKGVLNMTLGRLTNMEADKLSAEMKSLQETIKDLDELVSSRERLLKVVEAEADEVVKKFGTPRRTAIELDSAEGSLRAEDIIPNEPSFVTLSKRGYVKRMKATTFQVQGRGGRGKAGARLKNDDAMENLIHAMDHDHMLFFSNEGIVYSIRTYEIPEAQRTAQGTPVTNIITIPKAGAVTAVLSTAAFDENECLVMATTGGLIKKVKLSDFAKVRSSGLIAIKLKEGDSLAFVERCGPGSSVMVVSDTGRLLHFDTDSLRPLSRSSMGVKSMRLKPGEKVVGMSILPPEIVCGDTGTDDDEEDVAEQDDTEDIEESLTNPVNAAPWILLITKKGLGKRIGVRHFSMRGRGCLGMLAMRLREGDSLAFMGLVGLEGRQPEAPGSSSSSDASQSSGDIVAVSREGLIQRNSVANIPLKGRYARGASLMRLQDDDEVIGATYAPTSEALDAAE